jgi:hypothetical protein
LNATILTVGMATLLKGWLLKFLSISSRGLAIHSFKVKTRFSRFLKKEIASWILESLTCKHPSSSFTMEMPSSSIAQNMLVIFYFKFLSNFLHRLPTIIHSMFAVLSIKPASTNTPKHMVSTQPTKPNQLLVMEYMVSNSKKFKQ